MGLGDDWNASMIRDEIKRNRENLNDLYSTHIGNMEIFLGKIDTLNNSIQETNRKLDLIIELLQKK